MLLPYRCIQINGFCYTQRGGDFGGRIRLISSSLSITLKENSYADVVVDDVELLVDDDVEVDVEVDVEDDVVEDVDDDVEVDDELLEVVVHVNWSAWRESNSAILCVFSYNDSYRAARKTLFLH